MPASREKQAAGGPVVDPMRVKLIETARADWITRLIDLSRRNNLLYFRSVPTGSIEVPTDSVAMTELLAGKAVAAQTLLRDAEDRPGRVLSIARKAQENSEEKGLQTLYLALGFATWKASDGGRDAKAPVFLLPVQMRRKGRELTAIEVQVDGDVKVNPVLLHFVSDEFDIDLSEEVLVESVTPKEREEDSPADTVGEHSTLNLYRDALASLSKQLGKIPGFGMDTSAAISNFSFAKLALVNDLKQSGDLLMGNDVVAAIAGDNQARASLGSSQVEIDPHRLDATPPEQEFCVVEADSSQQCAIAGIAAGQNAVIHGPPGTGKSQTITNLIATLVARGKTVLFVAEKRAALEVVQQRLERCGLDHLAMDLHGAELSSKKVMERVARTLNVVRSSKAVEVEVVHRQFQDRRTKLNAHDAQMHTASDRTGKTVYEIQGALLRLPVDARTTIRWRGPELDPLTPAKTEQIYDLLREAAPFESLFMRNDPSPWTGIEFRSAQEVQHAIDLSQRLSRQTFPLFDRLLVEFGTATKLAIPERWTDLDAMLAMFRALQESFERYELEVFTADIWSLIQDLDIAKGGGLKALWLSWTNDRVKAALKNLAGLRKGSKIGAKQGSEELKSLEALRKQWKVLAGGSSTPAPYGELPGLEAICSTARREVEDLQAISHKAGWEKLSFKDLSERIKPFAADALTPYRMLSLTAIEGKLRSHGVQRLIEDFRQQKCSAALWGSNFDHAWLSSALDEMVIKTHHSRVCRRNARIVRGRVQEA